ncbi:MAG: OmpA family protein [Paludibacteraceae bacterium]
MKKTFILLLTVFVGLGLATAQSSRNLAKQDSLYNLKEKKESHWSITLEGGINRFDGDIIQDYNSLIPKGLNKLTLGGSVEYTLTPVWSMGIDYYYLPLAAHANYSGGHYADFDGTMHNVNYFMSFNLLKAFYKNTKTKWGLWLNAGAGYAWYKSNYITTREGLTVKDGHGRTYVDFSDTIDDGRTFVIPVGLLAEYNISKNLAIGAKLYYRGFNRDYIEQRVQHGVTNDFLEMATLQLRWKFNAQDRNHTRNINLAEFNNDVKADQLKSLENRLNKRIDSIPKPIDPTEDLKNINDRVKKLENYLDIDGPDDDNDGVSNNRDKEPNTPAGSIVNFWGQKINTQALVEESAFIYFDFDQTNLDEEAIKAIDLAAKKLKANPNLMVEVRGYTDNMGNNTYNQNLSQRRADKVKDRLVNMYSIDPNRIIANGKGKFDPQDKTMPHRPYRTCILFYSN